MKQFIFIFMLLLVIHTLSGEIISGKVISIKDGDTIEILYKNKAERIRLFGVDCPEKNQDYGSKARQFTADLVFNKTVKADIKNKDMYGRSVAEIILPDGQSLNRELVKKGYAWHYKEYSKDETLAELENQARAQKKGLWASAQPQAPWEFRKEQKSGKVKSPTVNKPGIELTSGAFVASKNSKKFHRSICTWAKKIDKKNRIYFNRSVDAKNQGYEPCEECKP